MSDEIREENDLDEIKLKCNYLYTQYNALQKEVEDLRNKQKESFQKKEDMKTALDMMHYNMYVNERRKNVDFPEEKQKICDILPVVNLSITDKIDIGRILFYRKFNATFPANSTGVNILTQEPYMRHNEIYIRFTRITLKDNVVCRINTCVYNILLNTYNVEKDITIDEFMDTMYKYTDFDLEKTRRDAVVNKIHALEHSTV